MPSASGALPKVSDGLALAERVAASGQRDGFLVVHGHTREGFLHVARHSFGIVRIAARTFGIDVDQAHLDRGERVFERLAFIRQDAGFRAGIDPLFLGAPVNVLFRLVDVLAAAAEAEHRAAHRFDGDIAGEHEQVGPADVLAVFLLDRPQQAARLVEIAVIRPAVERSEPLLARRGTAAPVAGAIGARRVPGHADEERAVMPVIRWPPILAVGHQRLDVGLEACVIDRVERLAIIEILAHRIGRRTALRQDVQVEAVGPPILVGPAEQAAKASIAVEGAAADISGLGVHDL